MADVFAAATSGSEGLQEAGVLEFSQARAAIEATLGRPEGAEAEQGLDVLQLTAAELALLPVFLMPQTLSLPLPQPMSVPGWAGLGSVVKGSCSLNRPWHFDSTNLATFAGDFQKLAQDDAGRHYLSFAAEPAAFSAKAEPEEPDWLQLADGLQQQHRRADTAIGHAIADSGVVRLQTMIWAAKWTAIVPGGRADLGGLARSLGVVS